VLAAILASDWLSGCPFSFRQFHQSVSVAFDAIKIKSNCLTQPASQITQPHPPGN